MGNHNIVITGIENGHLLLSPKGTVYVNPMDTVSWVIEQESGIGLINVIDNSNSANVFDPDPSPLGSPTIWQGTINPHISTPAEETYSIFWSINGGDPQRHDPKIQVNP
jgi:hypothetical protein